MSAVAVEKYGIMFEVRRLEKLDGRFCDLWKKRCALIVKDKKKQATYEHCYPKYPTKADANVKAFCTRVNTQLALYRGKKGIFSREWIFDAAEGMPAYLWWDQYQWCIGAGFAGCCPLSACTTWLSLDL